MTPAVQRGERNPTSVAEADVNDEQEAVILPDRSPGAGLDLMVGDVLPTCRSMLLVQSLPSVAIRAPRAESPMAITAARGGDAVRRSVYADTDDVQEEVTFVARNASRQACRTIAAID